MQHRQPRYLPFLAAVKQLGKKTQLSFTHMNHAIRVAMDVPIAVFVLDAGNWALDVAVIALLNGFYSKQIADGLKGTTARIAVYIETESGVMVYTITGNPYRSAAYMVMADDEEREYGDAAGAEAKKAEYEALGLEIISMRDDFGTIYGEKVEKVEPAA